MRTDTLQQFVNLRRGLSAERESLQQRLRLINEALGDLEAVTHPTTKAEPAQPTGKRTMSPEARARIAAAQRARWAAQKGDAAPEPSGAGAAPKRKMSAAGRRAIAEAARRRWAAAKAAGKSTL